MSGSSRRLELRVAALQDAALCAASAPMMGSLEAARLRLEVDRQFGELLSELAPSATLPEATPPIAAAAASVAILGAHRASEPKGLSRRELAKARELAAASGRSPAPASPHGADVRAE
jgi:hypothetical protein